MINIIALTLSTCIILSFLILALDLPHTLGLFMVVLTGFPMFSVSAPTFQFIAEVIYPVSEVQGISLVNMINKLVSFALVKVENQLPFFAVFFIWAILPLLGLIPGWLVEEDLRRLNIPEVARTVAVEDSLIISEGFEQVMATYFKNHVVYAHKAAIEQLKTSHRN
jgi:hypothetical protein